jgi:hypothetical protein
VASAPRPQITSGKLSSRAATKRKISPNYSIPPQPSPTLRHGLTETSFEPFPGPPRPCWFLCRRCPEARLRDAHGRWEQNSDYHPQEWPDRESTRLRCSIRIREPNWPPAFNLKCFSDPIASIGCHRVLPLGPDLDRRCLDRCRFASRDGRDQRHRSLPRAPGLQGTKYLVSKRSSTMAKMFF